MDATLILKLLGVGLIKVLAFFESSSFIYHFNFFDIERAEIFNALRSQFFRQKWLGPWYNAHRVKLFIFTAGSNDLFSL